MVGCPQTQVPTTHSDGGSHSDGGGQDAGPQDAGATFFDAGFMGDAGPFYGTCGRPTITSVTPPYGPTVAGNNIVLLGRCFANGFAGDQAGLAAVNDTMLSFGGNMVDPTTLSIIDDSTMTVVAPPGVAGKVDIALVNPNGIGGCTSCYTYVGAIVIKSVSSPTPPQGPTTGGTAFVLTGSGFAPGQLVLVGGADATDVVVAGDGSSLTAVTPPGVAGSADISVISAQTSATLSRGWVYLAPIQIASIAPSWSALAGGGTATITGSGFSADDMVTIGATAAATTYVSPTELTIVIPPATSAGAVGVTITAARTMESVTLANGFAYVDPNCTGLALFAVSPEKGSTTGGTCAAGTGCLQLAGCGFAAGLSVEVGVNNATVYLTPNNSNIVTLDLPAAAAPGLVDISARIVEGGNQYSASLPRSFEYLASLSITSITPGSGPATAQPTATATITGTGFSQSCMVSIGANAAAVQSASQDGTSLVITIPPGSEGPNDVIVTCGSQQAILPGGYSYAEPLNLLLVNPNTGSIAGGELVSLSGSGFVSGMTVTFGHAAATNVTVTSPHAATVLTPPGNVGFVDVIVNLANATQTCGAPPCTSTLSGGFGYYDPANSLGGSSGGPMRGVLNVTCLNSSIEAYGQPIPGVTVSINSDELTGTTDNRGEVTLNGPDLLKPVDITASETGFETVSMTGVNALNVTLYMAPTSGGPPPPPMPPPPPPQPATFKGVLCGFQGVPPGAVTAGAHVEAHVFFTDANVYSAVPFAQPDTPVLVSQDCGTWELSTFSYGATAIWGQVGVVAANSSTFTPYVMGFVRGLEAEPGVTVSNIDLVMSTHLDLTVPITVETSTINGSYQNTVYSYLDLGGEGVVPLGSAQATNTNTFNFTNHPHVDGIGIIFLDELSGLDPSGNQTYPVAFQYARDDGNVSDGVTIGPMPAFTKLLQPASGGNFTGTLQWSFGSGPLPNLQQVQVTNDTAGATVWSIVLPGTQRSASLPGSALASTLPPAGSGPQSMSWVLITSQATQFDYNNMTNSALYLNSWTGFTENFGTFTYTAP
jgi:hypothetical protein